MTETLVRAPIRDKSFFLGGNDEFGNPKGCAIFTVQIPPDFAARNGTQPHYTYQVRYKPAQGTYPENWFIGLLAGPDNHTDYQYLGILEPPKVRLTKGSAYNEKSWPVKILRRIVECYWHEQQHRIEENGWKVMHEGKCCVCGRRLTVPSSVESGYGPECRRRLLRGQ